MATVIKSVFVTENHSAYLYESGAVILRMNGSKFGTLMDRDLADGFGSETLSKLVRDGEILRAPKDKPKAKGKAAATVNSTDSHRVDIMQAQLDSLAKTNAAILQMLQAQASRPALNVAE